MGHKLRLKKALVLFLTALLVFSTVPVRAIYADTDTPEGTVQSEAAPASGEASDSATDPNAGEEASAEVDDSPGAVTEEPSASSGLGDEAERRDVVRPSPASPEPAAEKPAAEAPEEKRTPIAFDADEFVKRFSFTLESEGVSKRYELTNGQSVDVKGDFPDGLARSATYAGDLTLSVRSMAESQGAYPLVAGDTLTCSFPTILRPNGTLAGRLRDSSADWDSQHGGVGDYRIEGGKLHISYDEGYLEEKSGKVVESSIKFAGGFDTSTQTEKSFDFELVFGSVTIGTRFSKLEIVRNLSVEKEGLTNSDGYAAVGTDGLLTYTLKVAAGQDNTHTLKHVKVTDAFTDGSERKVDLSSMRLKTATIDGEDISARLAELKDGQGHVNGWDIGNLPAGQTATIVYTVKIDKDRITDAVDAAKSATPATDAAEARTICNIATASADEVPAVTDDFSMPVRNAVYVSKSSGRYDWKNQAQHFNITVRADAANTYTGYYVPLHDYLTDAPAASSFEEAGVSSAIVTHADGTQEDVPLAVPSHPSSREWAAALPQVAPGDTYKIDAYVKVSDAYWAQTGSGTVGDSSIRNNVELGSGVSAGDFYANDLTRRSDYSYFGITKSYLRKSSPSINSDGTVTWTVWANEQGKSSSPTNIAGQTITDVLGPDQVFPASDIQVVFYNQDGSEAGRDSIKVEEGDTSFSYTVPSKYGTCGIKMTYSSKITDWDSYVGPAKSYTNSVRGPWDISTSGTTSVRARVPRITKKFVKQADDWSQWKTSIYNELDAGDTYTDTVRNGTGYMYFTEAELQGMTLAIDGVAVDPSLYRVEPIGEAADGKYASFQVAFAGKVRVTKGGKTLTPSSKTPLTISYTAKMVDPASGSRDYYNDASLKVGDLEETDYDYCRRANRQELSKSVFASSKGVISWKVRANYYGYSGQPDGTCIVTDTLPAGTEFVSAYKDSGYGSVQVIGTQRNEDGTTTLTIKLSGLSHFEVSKDSTYDGNGSVELHFIVKTRVTDEDYLYGSETKDFTFMNKVSLNDRYGHYKESTATATIHHSAIRKTMAYNESTAPYARFAVEVNQEKVDLNPDGDTVGIVDVSSDSLELDPNSINVLNATTGDPVPFEVDASSMAENRVTIKVPDEMYVKIVYNAQVLGMTGKKVTVGNTAYFEGHRPGPVNESSISETVTVMKATGQAVSEPMVWLSKRDENAAPLAGATYELSVYDAASGWSTVRDGIRTKGDKASKGLKVESLELGKLYRLVETSAPEGYVLDATPRYFVLYGEDTVAPAMPKGLSEDDVFEGPSGSVVTAYNAPYSKVAFQKVDDEGRLLAGARLQVLDAQGAIARDASGAKVEMTSSADGAQEFVLAPGTYRLHEVAAPEGYELANDIEFTVTGDGARTVEQDGKPVDAVSMADKTKTTSLAVRKRWLDANDRDGVRLASVKVQLTADGVPVDGKVVTLTAAGPDGTEGTDDDWTTTFDDLAVMQAGEKVSYGVEELDVADGYNASYSWDKGTAVVTNERSFEPISLKVEKRWDDEDNARGIRPDLIVVHLVADGRDTGVTADVRAEGPDGILMTDDDWTAVFSDLAPVEDDHVVAYTVKEEVPAGYRLAGDPERTEDGIVLTNELAPTPEEVPGDREAHDDGAKGSKDVIPETGDTAPFAIALAVAAGGAAVLIGWGLRRRRED